MSVTKTFVAPLAIIIFQKRQNFQFGRRLPTVYRNFSVFDIRAEQKFFAAEFFKPREKLFGIFDRDAADARNACARVENRIYIFIGFDSAAEINRQIRV